jgi:hypothetical protein
MRILKDDQILPDMKRNILRVCSALTGIILLIALAGVSCQPSSGPSGTGEPAAAGEDEYMNPVLGGDYPDPSILRVG